MSKNTELILSYYNYERPAAYLHLYICGNEQTESVLPEVENGLDCRIYGYRIYKRNEILIIEIPLRNFTPHYIKESKEIIEVADFLEEQCDKLIHNSMNSKRKMVELSMLCGKERDAVFIFGRIWNMRIIETDSRTHEKSFVFEAYNYTGDSEGFGVLKGDTLICQKIEKAVETYYSFSLDKMLEGEKELKELFEECKGAKNAINIENNTASKAFFEKAIPKVMYRMPYIDTITEVWHEDAPVEVIKNKHWLYPALSNQDEAYTDEWFYFAHPKKTRKKKYSNFQAKIYSLYAKIEYPILKKLGKLKPYVHYPKEITSKYETPEEIVIAKKNEEKAEARADVQLTEQELKVFNPDMIKFKDGIESSVQWNTLDKMVGLETIKQEMEKLRNKFKFYSICENKGIGKRDIENLHMCFTGNPGTGKTTVARMITGMLYELGYIKYNECVEVNAQNLKGGYLGQTATITKAVIKHARGRVLFIDEAYALFDNYEKGFGKEAVAVLLKEMEDNRDDFVVIFAGYEKEMEKFLNMNEGLRSRINRYIHFPNYTRKELCQIFINQLEEKKYWCTEEALTKLFNELQNVDNIKNFSNARFIRNIVEKVIEEHAYNYMTAAQRGRSCRKFEISSEDLTDEIFEEVKTMSR